MAAEPKLRNLPPAYPTLLFRDVERQLRADPTCAAVVKTWRTWEGKPADKTPFSVEQAPWVRITPRMGPEEWWAASTMSGWQFSECEVAVEGTCLDDLLNLWGALQRACYPADATARNNFAARLRTDGAKTGLVKFSFPSVTNNPPAEGFTLGSGWVAVEYRFDTNPTAPGF